VIFFKSSDFFENSSDLQLEIINYRVLARSEMLGLLFNKSETGNTVGRNLNLTDMSQFGDARF